MDRQNPKDVANADLHSFAPPAYELVKEQQTFTITIFQWQKKRGGKSLKRTKGKVRIIAIPQDYDAALEKAEEIAAALDKGTYSGSPKVYFVPTPNSIA